MSVKRANPNKTKNRVMVVLVILAVIGAWTIIDNTYRLGCSVVHTVTTFNYHPAHILASN